MIVRVPQIDGEDETALLALWYADPEASVGEASPLPWFWLGAHEAFWAWEGHARGPVLIEARRLRDRRSKRARRRETPRYKPRRATVPVFIDSGAFSEVSKFGAWTWAPASFIAFIRETIDALGADMVRHVGIQDWMCEPEILAKTGQTVRQHQLMTVWSFLELRHRAPEVPWLPTLQGFTAEDYLRCAELYDAAGVALADAPLVGLGSVCRRSGTADLVAVIQALGPLGLQLHGYGVKSEGVLLSCGDLRSCDSAAWSERARWAERDLRRALFGPAQRSAQPPRSRPRSRSAATRSTSASSTPDDRREGRKGDISGTAT